MQCAVCKIINTGCLISNFPSDAVLLSAKNSLRETRCCRYESCDWVFLVFYPAWPFPRLPARSGESAVLVLTVVSASQCSVCELLAETEARGDVAGGDALLNPETVCGSIHYNTQTHMTARTNQ